jgi:TorA maturation chaperone TorD
MTGEKSTIDGEQRYRASACALLAALLRAPPGAELLAQVEQLSPQGDAAEDELSQAMAALAEAARDRDIETIEDEYNALFIGVGRGELVPYGSWYLTGFLMEKPLSDLRDDLAALGFERSEETREPEDHVAAIFEVFSVMIEESSSHSEQHRFFVKHMKPWLGRFFADLAGAKTADFYKPVARFGAAILDLESAYLSMHS